MPVANARVTCSRGTVIRARWAPEFSNLQRPGHLFAGDGDPGGLEIPTPHYSMANSTTTSQFDRSSAPPLTSRAASVWGNLKGLLHDHALLALLEVQRASLSFAKIVGAAVIISVLVVSAWMGLVAAAIVWAVGAGANWGVAIAVGAALNLALAGALAWWIKTSVPDLLFAASLRQLRGDAPPVESAHDHTTAP